MFPLFSMLLSITITGPSRPWSDRYLFSAFNASQHLSTAFNSFQRHSTPERLAVLKRVEPFSAVTFRTSLEGRSTRSVGRESLGSSAKRKGARVCPPKLVWRGSVLNIEVNRSAEGVERYFDRELAVSTYFKKESGIWAGRQAVTGFCARSIPRTLCSRT